jgi:capsular exopolysaccharide synthesis family protein
MERTESDLRTLLRVLRRRSPLIVLCLVGAVAAGLIVSLTQEKQYSAEASLLFRDPGFDQRLFGSSSFQPSQDPTREAATNVRLASLDVVADRTAKGIGGLDGDDVSRMVDVESDGESDVVAITATDHDPELAAKVANSFARNYIDFRREADQAKVENAQNLVESEYEQLAPAEKSGEEGRSLQQQISRLKTLQALQTGNAELVQTASPPTSPSSPKPVRNTLLAGFLGLLLGLGLALLYESIDRRLKDPTELEESFELPILGAVPKSGALSYDAGEQQLAKMPFHEAEAFRMIRTRLRYFNVDRDLDSLLITSASPSDGKTTVAFHLARTAAEAGTKTLLVEADLHEGTLAGEYGFQPLPGLAEVLTHQASANNVIQQVVVSDRTNGSGEARTLDVIVGGATPPNPLELLESQEMARLLEQLFATYDLVILDTPPAGVLADAIPLMRIVRGVILVGQLGKTTRDEATHVRQQLAALDAPLLGVVINKAQKASGYGYGYGYGYGGR